jgi:hypothetical protein
VNEIGSAGTVNKKLKKKLHKSTSDMDYMALPLTNPLY